MPIAVCVNYDYFVINQNSVTSSYLLHTLFCVRSETLIYFIRDFLEVQKDFGTYLRLFEFSQTF